jgi:hypothetical protein
MRERPPITVWLSSALWMAAVVITSWHVIQGFDAVAFQVDNPNALRNSALEMGFRSAAVWLLVGLPSLGILYGVRFCRILLTIYAVLDVIGPLVHPSPESRHLLTVIIVAAQLLSLALLFVGPSRAFFRRP